MIDDRRQHRRWNLGAGGVVEEDEVARAIECGKVLPEICHGKLEHE
jgi:hypothetical protein